MNAPEPLLADFLRRMRLAPPGEEGCWIPLSGGVSSDIWRVDIAGRSLCVKRALARLKVAAEWTAPIERNAYEWAYLEVANEIAPGHVPQPIAQDPEHGLFAMAWLAPDRHRLWKAELLSGQVNSSDAAAVGDLVGRIHAATADDPRLRATFATDANFHAIRIEPYLLATARAHPDLADHIGAVASTTAATKRVLVHGDVSPKNILLGPDGPILLDAECAWFGDPAFDLAFCLNHLIAKAHVVSSACTELSRSFDVLVDAYLRQVGWELPSEVERRAAQLLPCLLLARVDGKSPLEYLDDKQRGILRNNARHGIIEERTTLCDVKRLLLERPVQS